MLTESMITASRALLCSLQCGLSGYALEVYLLKPEALRAQGTLVLLLCVPLTQLMVPEWVITGEHVPFTVWEAGSYRRWMSAPMWGRKGGCENRMTLGLGKVTQRSVRNSAGHQRGL